MKWIPLALSITAVLLSGCVTPPDDERERLNRTAAAYEEYLREFQLAQAEFERSNPVPFELESREHGTLIITACGLEGRVGSELVRVRFTYVNTTQSLVESGRVVLTLIDTLTGTEWSETIDMKLPYSRSFAEGSSYTGNFHMPTEGLHRKAGWEWRIEFETTAVSPEEGEEER